MAITTKQQLDKGRPDNAVFNPVWETLFSRQLLRTEWAGCAPSSHSRSTRTRGTWFPAYLSYAWLTWVLFLLLEGPVLCLPLSFLRWTQVYCKVGAHAEVLQGNYWHRCMFGWHFKEMNDFWDLCMYLKLNNWMAHPELPRKREGRQGGIYTQIGNMITKGCFL